MTQYMTPAFGSSHFLLALVIGACGAIGLLHLCLWQRSRTDTTHLWVAAFCGSSVVFQIGRYLEVQAQTASDAVLGGRIQVTAVPVMVFCLLTFARSINHETKGRPLYVFYSLLAGLLSVVGAFTEFMITDQVFDSVDSFGYRHQTPLGGVGVIFLAAFALPTYVHLIIEVRRSPRISALEKRVVLASVFAFALVGALAAASSVEAIRFPSLVQYAPFLIAAGLSFLLVHQHARMRSDLEAMANERARKLLLSDLRYEQLVQDAPVGIFALDAKGRLRAINGRLCGMLGVPDDVRALDGARQGFRHALPQLHASGIAGPLDACLETGRPFADEFEWEGADGARFAVRARGVAIRDPAGEIVGVQAIVEDIAERRALEERVRLSQKMDAVGGLAAGIAHEINNPMSYVRANLSMIDDELEKLARAMPEDSTRPDGDFATIHELVADVTEGVERTVDIVRDVNEFARGLEHNRSEADLNDLVHEALRMASTEILDGIRVTERLGDLPRLACSPGQIRQVLSNLVVNAYHAMQAGGELTLVTEHLPREREIRVRISDTGCGIPEAQIGRVFEPFFTSKGAGKGTGLGLYICYEIMRMHDGRLQVESKVGEGTSFELCLPITKLA